MIALTCPKCGSALNVDDARAGGSARCPGCGASMPVPARSAPASSAQELSWSKEVGPPPVRRRDIPPPPVIDVVDADEVARAEARVQPRRAPTGSPREPRSAGQSHYTDAELGITKPVSPLRSARRERAEYETVHIPQPVSGVSVGQILLGCSSSALGFLVLIGAIVMAFLEPLDSTPKFIVWLVVLLTGIFLFGGGIIITVVKGMMGK